MRGLVQVFLLFGFGFGAAALFPGHFLLLGIIGAAFGLVFPFVLVRWFPQQRRPYAPAKYDVPVSTGTLYVMFALCGVGWVYGLWWTVQSGYLFTVSLPMASLLIVILGMGGGAIPAGAILTRLGYNEP
jgi:hypothetical protein